MQLYWELDICNQEIILEIPNCKSREYIAHWGAVVPYGVIYFGSSYGLLPVGKRP